MKVGNYLVIIGGVILVLGIIFDLQGNSIVGPESSFMYANPDWVTYGFSIAIVGGVIVGLGISLSKVKPNL